MKTTDTRCHRGSRAKAHGCLSHCGGFRQLNVNVPHELDEWFRAAAIDSGRSLAECLREALSDWLEKQEPTQ